MGIEDLNLDLAEFADRVAVVSPSDELQARLQRLLQTRSYNVRCASTEADLRAVAASELYDLLILDGEACSAFRPEVEAIRKHPAFARTPVIALLADKAHKLEAETVREVTVLDRDAPDAELLVKVSLQLRLKKRSSEQARFETEIAGQNAQLRDLTTRFKQELKEARAIQQSILPTALPKCDCVVFASTYVPLEAVGGDLYDIWKLEDGRFGLFIGDVTGHGLSAAFIGAMTKMALAYASKASPETMLFEMNDGIADHMPEGKFVTCAAAIIDPETKALHVARAGHPNPYLFRKSTGEVEELAPQGLPIGVVAGMPYELVTTEMSVGDKFIMVTDGLTEAMNMDGDMLGPGGVREHVRESCASDSMSATIGKIVQKAYDFSGGRIIKDDITLVGFEIVDR